jgi:hypothetical protein
MEVFMSSVTVTPPAHPFAMPTTSAPSCAAARRPVVLANAEALRHPMITGLDPDNSTLIVAGSQIVQMTLAELALPGAQMIWTDFRQSASVGRLHQEIDQLGGLDHLILVADGARAESTFSAMCAILSLLPALRRRPMARISMVVEDGTAVSGLQEFLSRLAPRLLRQNISISLQVEQPVAG